MSRPLIILACASWSMPGTAAAEDCRRVVPQEMMEWPHVELLDAGASPRRLLRVELAEGRVERRTLDLGLSMARVDEGEKAPAIPLPVLTFEIETRVESVDPSGLATVSFRYLHADVRTMPGVPIDVLRSVRDGIRDLDGVEGQYLLTSCLYADSLSIMGLDELDSSYGRQLKDLQAGIGLLSDPFPDESVGVGAQWRVKWERVENAVTHPRTGGIRIEMETLYTVESIQGDRVQVRSETRQTAAKQPIAPPEMPHQLVTLLSLESTGTATHLWELSSVLPLESTGSLETEQVLMVEHELEDVVQTQRLEVRSSLRREDSP